MSNSVIKPKKKLLYEVSVIRPIIIFLLVFLHSFSKINNGGGEIRDYQLPTVYQWLCQFILGFRIETIALIAGYVFSYQCNDLNRTYVFGPFVWKKFKRLILPMLFFGIIYYVCFLYSKDSFAFKDFLLTLFSGCGHLWFLPMLFWCFISIWIIDYLKISSWLLLFVLALFSISPMPSFPLGFNRFPHFLFFVYAGYFLWTKRLLLFRYGLNNYVICTLCLLYFLLVIISYAFVPTITNTHSHEWMSFFISSILKFLMSCCGILALYLLVCRTTQNEGYKPKEWVIQASDDCYGLYVFHQFILVWLYFYTPLFNCCNEYLLPWVGFLITFSLSLILTRITLKTKLGKFLIG